MVNAPFPFRLRPVLLLALPVLAAAVLLRSAEYDEQYSLFLTGSVVRPDWPGTPFPVAQVHALQTPAAAPWTIAQALRETDVHPPLYFWLLAAWRHLAGDGLATARALSVGCALATLALVGRMAARIGAPPGLAALLTLGCYGFVYTGAIARSFALAQALLMAGAALLFSRRRGGRALVAGLCLGAATSANYLAVFPAAGLLAGWASVGRLRLAAWAGTGLLPWLGLDAWFFAAQRGSRPDQFPPFELLPGMARLGRYAVANMVGGLPLYVPSGWQVWLGGGLALLVLVLAGVTGWWQMRAPATQEARALALATLAPAAGLLVLGAMFDITPIELRYLAFALPMGMPLLARALCRSARAADGTLVFAGMRRRRWLAAAPALVLAVQGVSITGLLIRPETMQPARRVAAAAAKLAAGGIVLVPAGNDGVGIIGAFGQEAPPGLPMLAVWATDSPAAIRARIAMQDRVVLAEIVQDAASRSAVATMRLALADPCWRMAAAAQGATAYRRICPLAPDPVAPDSAAPGSVAAD